MNFGWDPEVERQLDFLKAFGVAFGVQVEGALEKARGEVHTMIGTIRTAFDALKNTPPQQGLGAPVPAGAVPAARHPS